MPLNLKENEESGRAGGPKSEPIVHKPKENMSGGSKTILVTVVVIVLIVGVGVLYKSGYIGMKKNTSTEEMFIQPTDTAKAVPVDSVAVSRSVEQPKSETVGQLRNEKPMTNETGKVQPKSKTKLSKKHQAQPEPKAEAKSSPKPIGTGQYTIYAGSYKSKTTADEEVGRWNEAGYQAFVRERPDKTGTLYSVCLGHYGTKDEAQQQAEKLKDAFEGGYWVDVVK